MRIRILAYWLDTLYCSTDQKVLGGATRSCRPRRISVPSRSQLAISTRSTIGISPASKRHIGSWGGDHSMGLLWRLFAPKPLKKARRTVRKAAHPVRTTTRAVTPKPVKQLQRAAHPVSLAELKIEDTATNALLGRPRHQQSRHTAQPSTEAPPPSKRNTDEQGRPVTTRSDERPAWMPGWRRDCARRPVGRSGRPRSAEWSRSHRCRPAPGRTRRHRKPGIAEFQAGDSGQVP